MKSIKGLVSKYPYGYYNRAKGVNIWDIENRKLIDMGIMGVGSCILGYADEDVNEAVKECIDKGSMSTYNCYEEIELADLLLSLNPCMDKVRYAKTGGEALAIALKLAQSHSGIKDVLTNGYHGWHINNPFEEKEFNLDIVKPHIIFLEFRDYPDKEFIEKINELQKSGSIIIMDEISSGFRACTGGLYTLYDLKPDLVVFGKAMGNGFPITAIIGKENIMDTKAFISSTFFTERIGSVAGLATINKIIKDNVVNRINWLGNKLIKGLRHLGFDCSGFLSLMHIERLEKYSETMLERGYITGNRIYLSYAHNEQIIEDYLKNMEEIL